MVVIKVSATIPGKEGDVIHTPFGDKIVTAAEAASGFYDRPVVAVRAVPDGKLDAARAEALVNAIAAEAVEMIPV